MSSLWDEIKDLFKTDKQLEEERQQKINSALEKESDVSKRLAELENSITILCRKTRKSTSIKSFRRNRDLKKSSMRQKATRILRKGRKVR